ncbi:hypothetical protein [Acinetobacter sp. ANC 3813]|uniref:hypothetical protein n=1 Tax=Acinetobacter sp. ANC 3813 TaxID=1977873 RepID=UPI000A34F6FD|nr:hypothetical protein [Acinetobacter sp. ANC 3813]OTG88853.1 hypothetical protein B9T34_13905 [Acinetobacter sp. ANC 3813]
MIAKILAAVFIVFTCSSTFAICTISDTGAGVLRLQPNSGETSTIQFNIKCDDAFSIQFNSQNLQNSNGQSFLKNESALGYTKLKNTLDIKYDLSGDAGAEWNKTISQNKKANHTYTILARLGAINLESLAVGDYRDRITVNIDY